jgi:class 3 adenylate cyclase
VRAGLHTGECEVRGDDIGGIGVHIGARVSALAGPNDVLVSSTLRDLVAGRKGLSNKPSPARLWHRLGPGDMALEAKRFRHVAVAIPEVAVGGFVAASPS